MRICFKPSLLSKLTYPKTILLIVQCIQMEVFEGKSNYRRKLYWKIYCEIKGIVVRAHDVIACNIFIHLSASQYFYCFALKKKKKTEHGWTFYSHHCFNDGTQVDKMVWKEFQIITQKTLISSSLFQWCFTQLTS